MTKQDKDKILLEQSVAHWNEELDKLKNNDIETIDIGSSACPLCQLYAYNGCEGCPIAVHTNAAWCGNTPYADAYESLRRLQPKLHPKEYSVRKAIAAFREEIDFLKGLLDEFSD